MESTVLRPHFAAATLALLGAAALPALAQAACPSTIPILEELYCSSEIDSFVDHTEPSLLGGACEDSLCYSCGDPWAEQDQVAPEAVYSFECQLSGTVSLLITNLPCDLDIYALDSSCDPYGEGCIAGSTASYAVDDLVVFDCTAGETYYIVIEAYGTAHLDLASGPCTDSSGTVYSPTYTLSFDVSASTGCAEDCDDGLDNDNDGPIDCDDPDCRFEDVCCDLDEDGYFSLDCGGLDCDDSNPAIHPGATEDPDNGIDDDCDGDTDEVGPDFDDDGDPCSENDGDCDDDNASVNPDAPEIPDNEIDDDCDGEIDEVDGDDDDSAPPADDDDDDSSDDDSGLEPPVDDVEAEAPEVFGCDCGDCGGELGGRSSAAPTSLVALAALLLPALRRRRRR